MIRIKIEGDAIPAARPRFGNGRAYQPKRNAEFRQRVQSAAQAAMAGREPITGEVGAFIRVYRKYKPTTRRSGDLDNHLKSIFDGCNKIVFNDDSQVTRCVVEKFQDENPRVEVLIAERLTYDNQ